jgi:hypothetical protein
MWRRFVSASAVAAIAITVPALVVFLLPAEGREKFQIMTHVWCFAPAAWGVWAMLAPARWVPERLPLWGSLLGLLAGLMVTFLLDMPARILGAPVPLVWRIVPVVALVVVYFLLWMLVRAAFRSLAGAAPTA